MKVMMIIRSQSGVPGGAGVPGGQIGMIQLAHALSRIDIDVELFVGGPRMTYFSGLDGITTTYFHWPVWFDRLMKASPAPIRTLGTILRQKRWLDMVTSLPGISSADVIHIQGLADTEVLLDRFSGPIVVTHWGRVGRWLPRDGSKLKDDESLFLRISRIRDNVKLMAIGEAQGEAFVSAGMPPAAIIPPGIDWRPVDPWAYQPKTARFSLLGG